MTVMLEKSTKIAFIGAGAMGSAIAIGLTEDIDAKNIMLFNRSEGKLTKLKDKYNFSTSTNFEDVIAHKPEYLIIAVKPKDIKELLAKLSDTELSKLTNTSLISVAAGVTIKSFEEFFPEHPIFRVMPNTPSQISKGVSAISPNENTNPEQLEVVKNIFTSVGVSIVVPENKLDAVTAVSGSGPAYYFLMIEAMIEAGIKLGLTPHEAEVLATETAYGASCLAKASNQSAAELRKNVTSPNGTTQAALESFIAEDFPAIVERALSSAKRRSLEIAAGQLNTGIIKHPQKGLVLWLSGLSGSGKSTITEALYKEIKEQDPNYPVEILDGDVVREHLCKDLGFSKEDRLSNNERIAFMAAKIAAQKTLVLVPVIAPYEEARQLSKKIAEENNVDFKLVYVKASIEEVTKRDVKGLYKKALAGEIKNFTGISDPFEEPQNPDLLVETEKLSLDESLNLVKQFLIEKFTVNLG